MNYWIQKMGLILLLTAVAACGGGGGGGSGDTPPPQGSGNWDSLVWDQDDWS